MNDLRFLFIGGSCAFTYIMAVQLGVLSPLRSIWFYILSSIGWPGNIQGPHGSIPIYLAVSALCIGVSFVTFRITSKARLVQLLLLSLAVIAGAAYALPFLGTFFEPISAALATSSAILISAQFQENTLDAKSFAIAKGSESLPPEKYRYWQTHPDELPRESKQITATAIAIQLHDLDQIDGNSLEFPEFFFQKSRSLLKEAGAIPLMAGADSHHFLCAFDSRTPSAIEACHAVLKFQSAVSEFAAESKNRFGIKPRWTIGIATGLLWAKIAPRESPFPFLLHGEILDQAKQIATQNLRYSTRILLDRLTFHIARDVIAARPIQFLQSESGLTMGDLHELLGSEAQLDEESRSRRDIFCLAVAHWNSGEIDSARSALARAISGGKIDPVTERILNGMGKL